MARRYSLQVSHGDRDDLFRVDSRSFDGLDPFVGVGTLRPARQHSCGVVLLRVHVGFVDRVPHVREQFVRNEFTAKSRVGRRTIPVGDHAAAALEEQYQNSRHRADDSIVFCHPSLGTPLDPSKLGRYVRAAVSKARIDNPFRPWDGLRHTALTETAAAGVPAMFVQAKAGHAQGSTTERYLDAAKTSYPDIAELADGRVFAGTADPQKR